MLDLNWVGRGPAMSLRSRHNFLRFSSILILAAMAAFGAEKDAGSAQVSIEPRAKPANKGEGRNSLSSSFKAYENTSLAALCSKRCCTNPAN